MYLLQIKKTHLLCTKKKNVFSFEEYIKFYQKKLYLINLNI